MMPAQNPVALPATSAPLPDPADDQVRVLLVDDEVRNLETLEAVLAESGCQLVRAQSADEALLLLLEHDFAALVLDIKMPEMNGLELAQLIKGRKRTRDIPILFLTAYLLEQRDVLRGYKVGAVDYLQKPIHPEVLRAKIAVFAELYRKRHALSRTNHALEREVVERERAEAALREANQRLESRVAERTIELVRAHEVLQANQQRLRIALDAGRMGTWEVDEITQTNSFDEVQRALLGLPPGRTSMAVEEFLTLVHPDDVTTVQRAMEEARQSALEGGGAFEIEFRVLRPADRTTRWLMVRGCAVAEVAGRVTRTAGVSFDVTERKHTEQTLRDADRRKNEFLATLAHELRNPLAPISNAIHLLLLKGPPDPDLRAARDVIARQTRQLARLVDDLLDINRITQDKLELRREPVPLATIVNAAVETSRPLINDGGHELTVSLPEAPIILHADTTRLAQVISNLLNNAAKYSDADGSITLTATSEGGHVVIRVRDTGIGIADDVLPHIFDMFVQAGSSRSRAGGGLGVGLALAKRLVELHDGTITVATDGPGTGTEFTITLPILETAQSLDHARDGASGGHAQSSMRVLVVDDNQDAVETLAILLRLWGNDVRTACDGLEAVDTALVWEPDVVLLDVGLPRLDGYAAARRIRQQCCGRRPVLIALTGFGQENDRRDSVAAGFDHHITKPADPGTLMRLLADVDARRLREREVRVPVHGPLI